MKARRLDSEDVRVVDRGTGWAVMLERFGMSNPVGPRLIRGLVGHPLIPRLLEVRPIDMTKPAAEALATDWRRFLRAQESAEER